MNINDKAYKKADDFITVEEYNSLISKYMELDKLHNNAMGDILFLKAQLDSIRRLIYGAKSERFINDDKLAEHPKLPFVFENNTSIVDIKEEKEKVEFERKTSKTKKKATREPIPDNIPRKEEVIEPENLPEGSVRVGQEVTEVLEFQEGKIWVRRIIRPKYKTPEKQEFVVAEYCGSPIVASNFSPSILTYLFVSKFVDHLPFYRIAQILQRQGLKLAESTINDQLKNVCKLLEPLYNILKYSVLASVYLQIDETIISVLTKEKIRKTHTGYFWVYHTPLYRQLFFDYQPGRSKQYPGEILENYFGSIQTDAYVAYNQFDNHPDIITLACMAHVRRKFEHALDNNRQLSEEFLLLIQDLYEIERYARDENLNYDMRQNLRQAKAKPLLDKMEALLIKSEHSVLPKSPIGEAIRYAKNVWKKLIRYIDDGRYEIDNNLIENAIRPTAIGRKNYMFAGSHEGAKRAALMYSFFGSCKMQDVNPTEWLIDVLTRIPKMKSSELEQLLPINWKKNQAAK